MRWLWRFYAERMTHAGRWFLWPFLATGAYASLTLSNQPYVALAYATVFWLVAFASLRLCAPKVRLRVTHPSRVCAGETLPVEVTVENAGRRAVADLQLLPHRLPLSIDAVPEDGIAIPPVPAGRSARATLGLRCGRRGEQRLRGWRAETDFPLGLLNARRVLWSESAVLVYPRFTPLARLELPTGRRYQPGGVALASVVGESTEFIGNREYREGDSLRDIDWKATARMQRPIVREYREEYFLRVAVILDTHVPAGAPAARREDFERAVSICAAVGDSIARQESIVDIFAAGPDLYHLVAGRGLAYLDQILDILACVEESPAEPFAAIEPELAANLERITSVVCVFLDWDERRRAFVENMRQQGVGIRLVVVRDAPCALDPAADPLAPGRVAMIDAKRFSAGVEEL